MFLVWYDNDRKRPIADKIAAAAERYLERFGSAPALVLLNPAQAGEQEEIAGLPVRPTPLVSPHHLYIGVEDAMEDAAPDSAAA